VNFSLQIAHSPLWATIFLPNSFRISAFERIAAAAVERNDRKRGGGNRLLAVPDATIFEDNFQLRLGSGADAYGDDIPFIPWVDSGVTGQFFRK